MTDPHDLLPAAFTTAYIVDNYDLTFDGGDQSNASLYLATQRGAASPAAALAILRNAGLWSADAEKQVADDQREAYKAGLAFVAAEAYRDGAGHFLLTRFDHPKFPSDAERWAAWQRAFAGRYDPQR